MRIQHYDEMCPMCVLKIVQRVSMAVCLLFIKQSPFPPVVYLSLQILLLSIELLSFFSPYAWLPASEG